MRNFQPRNSDPNPADDSRKLRTNRPVSIYARRSDPYARDKNKDRSQSREMQTDDMKKWAVKQGWTTDLIHPYFADLGLSGTLRPDQRPDMLRLFDDLDSGKFDNGTIVCFQENRLFRDETHIYYNQLIEKMLLHNVVLIVLSPRLYIYDMRDDHDKDRLREKLKEAAEFIPRQVKGWLLPARERAAQEYGEWAGLGDINIGFIIDYDENSPTYKKRIPYKPHADIVKTEIFEALAKAGGDITVLYERIKREPIIFPFFESWVDRRVVNKFNQWTQCERGYVLVNKQTLMSIVLNPVYIGYQMINGAIRRDSNGNLITSHEAIVNREIFFIGFYRYSKFDLDGTPIEGRTKRKYYYRGEENNDFGLLKFRARWSAGPIRTAATGEYTEGGEPTNKAVYVLYDEEKKSDTKTEIEEYAWIPCDEIDELIVARMFEHVRQYLRTANTTAYEREIKKQREERRKTITQIEQSITANENEQARLTQSLGKVKEVTQDPARQEHLQMLILDQVNVLEDARQGLLVDLAIQKQAQEDDIGSLDEELADLEELWSKFNFRKRQSYINFLIKDVVIDVVSTHWISIQVSWLHDVWGIEEMYHYRERGSHNKWTDEEDAIIRQHYPTMPKLELMELLPLRVWDAIIKRAKTLGVSRPLALARAMRSKVGYHPHLSHADITLMQELNIPIHKKGEEPTRLNTEWVKPLEQQ